MEHDREEKPLEHYVRRWPRLTAHLMAESLGYCNVEKSAHIIRDAHLGRENWCEWIFTCYRCDPTKAVRAAFLNRHHHSGYMAEYKLAKALVNRYLATGYDNLFAGWF